LRRIGRRELEVPIESLEPGDGFRFDTLEGHWQYGHLVFKNSCRVRAVLYDYRGPAFDHADENAPKGKDRELNLPLGIGVERLNAVEGEAQDGGQDMSPPADSIKAAGLVAKYNHQQKQWQKAIEMGDAAKAEVALNRVKSLEAEARTAEVELPEWDPERIQVPKPIELDGVHKPEPPELRGRALTAEEKREVAERQKAAAKAKAAKAAKAGPPPPKPEPKLAKTHDCLCGCAKETQALFSPGHDARVKGLLLKIERGELPVDVLPPTVAAFCKFSGKWGTEAFMIEAAPVKFPGRPEIEDMRQQALEALDV
jgi:hypothetical protein